jgi:glutathione S-transferase
MLKIYGRANSINVRKVLWVADEIGIAYDREDWGRGYRPVTDPEYKRLNRFERVPTIDDDGFILRESNTIVRYLTTKHGRTDLFPTDLQARFRVEAWMDWASNDLYEHIRPVVHALVFKTPGYEDPEIAKKGAQNWGKAMQMLEDQLASSGPFLMGDAFTIADIPAGLSVNRWFAIDFEKPAFPAISAYYDRLAERIPYQAHGRNGTP